MRGISIRGGKIDTSLVEAAAIILGNEVMTVCCSAPEGQINFFSWDLDQFNQNVMMLKDASGSVQRCLSERRRSAVYGCSTLF